MIVVDASVIVAILLEEPGYPIFVDRIADASKVYVSAVSYQEAAFVLVSRFGHGGIGKLGEYLSSIRAEIVAHDSNLAKAAVAAFLIYGKGIHSRARLNFGDCATYALAQALGLPLLFKGDDFTATDRVAAV